MTGPFKYLNDGPIENMEIGKRNQNSNRGKLENTETNSEVKYFTTYIIQDGLSSIIYQHLRYYQDITCQTGKMT